MTIAQIQNDVVEEFSMFEDWEERYDYIIALGKSLPLIEAQYKIKENLIRGCLNKVWLRADLKNDKVIFTADSESTITKGIIAILIRIFSNQEPGDIMTADMGFLDKIGLKEYLSPNRANGLLSMIKQMKMYALAYQTKINAREL